MAQTLQTVLLHLTSLSPLTAQPPIGPPPAAPPPGTGTPPLTTQPLTGPPPAAPPSGTGTPSLIAQPPIGPPLAAPTSGAGTLTSQNIIPPSGITTPQAPGLHTKIPSIPLPSPLSADATLRVYEEWKSSWEDYVIMAGLNTHPQRIQLAYLRRCLDSDMKEMLIHSLGVSVNSAMPLCDIIQLIDNHMRRQRNQTLRRQQFNQCRQAQGQSFDTFYVRLKQMAADADLCRHCLDDRLLDGIISGVSDRDLAERIQALDIPPSLSQVVNMCRSHEAARRSNAELPTYMKINKISKYKERKRSKSRPRSSDERNQTSQKTNVKLSCFRCGDKSRHTDGKCPASDMECKKCHKRGHFTDVCH